MNEEFYITKTRSVSEIISISYRFFSVAAVPLLKALLLFAFPLIIVSIVTAIYVTNTLVPFDSLFEPDYFINNEIFVYNWVLYLFYVAGLYLYNLIINKHLVLSDSKEMVSWPSFAMMKENLIDEFRENISNFSVLFIIYFIAFHSIDYFFFEDQLIRLVFLVLLGPLVFYFLLTTLFVSRRDDCGVSKAFNKVLRCTQHKPGKAWLTSVLLLLICYFSNSVIGVFFHFANMLCGFLSAGTTIYTTIFILQKICTYFLIIQFQISIVLLLGSLEDEMDGHYIGNKIDKV